MAWVFLVLASLGEIFGVMSLNLYVRKKTFPRLALVGITFGLGFLFLSLAMREIPMSIAYAIWTGLGAAGAVLMGILFFREPSGWKRLLFLGCIIVGAAGLKLIN
ncbi:MAG: multidrug resistance protein SMR [Bacillus thermozeamaize]|uniref:Multidrug resistance protein SMR n=1 Tax=Bacillus thermozeamaize TaxID=230954 RepID=A0A1Y3PMT4_9BACI|nr:MAG: multidrug resistance protein SMR [Bacillus thermozeamaize]